MGAQVNNFRDFYKLHSKTFRFFGAVPIYKTATATSTPKFNPFIMAIIGIFLMVYWTGVVFTFLIDKHLNDKISVISNWIQMLGNSLALTVTLGCTVIKYADFDNIIVQFEKIDENLLAVGHRIDYSTHLRRSKLITFAHLTTLGAIMAYDFYVTIDMYKMTSVWYWAVSILPLFIYSMGLYHAMFMIYWIKFRCSLINKMLKTMRSHGGSVKLPGTEGVTPKGILLVRSRVENYYENRGKSPVAIEMPPALAEKPTRNGSILLHQKSMNLDMNTLSQLFSIMNDLCKLSRKIDEYYGLFFLTSIGALFSITSIQVYYCYVTAITFDDKLKYSIWTLMVSINLVTVNLSLIVGITTVCENVSNEATRILQNFSALQIKKDVPILNELSIWVHPMISYMRFSAYGFFTIDYNMLCGFMTALITYLVIFIQFYAINGDGSASSSIRQNNAQTPEPPKGGQPSAIRNT